MSEMEVDHTFITSGSFNHPITPGNPLESRESGGKLTFEQKTLLTLSFMKDDCRRFRLSSFLEGVFKSQNKDASNIATRFINRGEHLDAMEMWWDLAGGHRNEGLVDWIIEKASAICAREASKLTDRATAGPHASDAAFLRVAPENVTVDMVNGFGLGDLAARYERTLPNIQRILKSVVNQKELDGGGQGERHRNEGRTFVTSTLLYLRSRLTNYHAIMNSLIFWDFQVPKRLLQMFNHLGITTSYTIQRSAVDALHASAIQLIREAANDPRKIKMLPYDNFNWVSKKWEQTALHSNVTHDQVSALLVILENPFPGLSASDLTATCHFEAKKSRRHDLHPGVALDDILPSDDDHDIYRTHAIIHVQEILAEELGHFSQFRTHLKPHTDPNEIQPVKTEEYILPTFDQEQGSTRGNMIVLDHYFREVLDIPLEVFEQEMFTILGDRLTTARDRAAQDQRALDRSDHALDHLSCFQMISGLMHTELNYIEGIGHNYWGGKDADAVSLLTLRDVLPNRGQLNLKKVDYYGWLRFLDVILRALVVKGAMEVVCIDGPEDFAQTSVQSLSSLESLAMSVVDRFILPSRSQLEISGEKTLQGNTVNTHAVLLAQDLMALREMHSAIKAGHPTRILRMIKFWTPVFYATGRYNYASECMELLHNFLHDWPELYAKIAFNGMLVNPTGKPNSFKPTDLHVEHWNCRIKERAHGTNATPELLEKITPIMTYVRRLSDEISRELGVEARSQEHTHVGQHKDVEMLIEYFIKNHIYDFSQDQISDHTVLDLQNTGCQRLAGENGGHRRHLNRHQLRLRTRHGEKGDNAASMEVEEPGEAGVQCRDNIPMEFVISPELPDDMDDE